MSTSRKRISVWTLTIVLCALLVFGCVGIIFAAFYDYDAGSSGPHQINKLGYVEVTTPVANDVVVYPGASHNVTFTVQNSVHGGAYGTLPIRITNVTVSRIEATNVNGTRITLDNNVVNFTVNTFTSTTIQTGQTGTVTGTMTVKTPSLYSSGSAINVNSASFLTNESSIITITFLFEVEEAV